MLIVKVCIKKKNTSANCSEVSVFNCSRAECVLVGGAAFFLRP